MLETTGQTHTKELYVAEANKQCTKCKETLPLNSFHKYKETFRSHCKACRVLENIETHKRNNPKRLQHLNQKPLILKKSLRSLREC